LEEGEVTVSRDHHPGERSCTYWNQGKAMFASRFKKSIKKGKVVLLGERGPFYKAKKLPSVLLLDQESSSTLLTKGAKKSSPLQRKKSVNSEEYGNQDDDLA